MVDVINISKSFGSTKAVDDLSFKIGKGEIVGLLGPNGAGKTTTMRIITGFLSQDQGSVSINGINVDKDPILAQKQLGYLPENNPLYQDMLVSELLKYSARLKQIPKKDLNKSLDFAVENTGIKDVYYKRIGDLSKGFRQRVGIALCLLHRPNVLIMDEPTEGLDPNQRAQIRKLIKNLSKRHTIIMSTHVMQEVEAVCSRVIVINQGNLVADGKPKNLVKGAKGDSRFVVVLEGKNVEAKLRALKSLSALKLKRRKDKIEADILVKEKSKLPPIISELARKNKWIIWKLEPKEEELEDVFHRLTRKDKKK